MIRRGDEISYFEPGIDPFTIQSTQMVAPLPAIMQTNIEQLASMYDFVPLGRAREAGVASDVVRVSPKDGERYSYVLWIDQDSKLLVRADLLDRDGDPIEQYRALSVVISPQVGDMMRQLAAVDLPPVVHLPNKPNSDLNWQVMDLPVALSRYTATDTVYLLPSVRWKAKCLAMVFSVFLFTCQKRTVFRYRSSLFAKVAVPCIAIFWAMPK